ncbi:MAG: hypothetical protein JWL98_946 [Xanthomonadaceae bacterium]|nr:hypothetical protein [Xanthomonadaceae bacterium]
MRRAIVIGALVLATSAVDAADVCPVLRQQLSSNETSTRIAAVACNENMLWYRPFIAADGRIASITVMEGESSLLADGTEAWRRVAGYWRESGLLWQMGGFPGASECGYASGDRNGSPSCRAFVIDNPWSAAFVSWIMLKAGVPGFRASASHFDYVREAWLHPDTSPFQYLDPATTKPGVGDLLCYVRIPARAYGYSGLIAAIDSHSGSLNMHCDIVVAVNPDNDGRVYSIGGNVQQGVTMRLLSVNRNGNFWALPQRSGVDPPCSPDAAANCNFSRQDWSVLLKLKSPAALAQLPRPEPLQPNAFPLAAPPPACCVNCVVGAIPPVPRCPIPQP